MSVVATVPLSQSTQLEDKDKPPQQAVINVIVALIKAVPKFKGYRISRQSQVTGLRKELPVPRIHVFHDTLSRSNTGKTGPGRRKQSVASVKVEIVDNVDEPKSKKRGIHELEWLFERQIMDNPQIYGNRENPLPKGNHELYPLLHPDMVWHWMDIAGKEYAQGFDDGDRQIDMVSITVEVSYDINRRRPLG